LRLSTGAFAVLVAATIAAFFVTQHLKVTTPLIAGYPAFVPGTIDPLHPAKCGKYDSGSATISFYLQHRSDTVDVSVVSDTTGAIVDTLATGRRMRTYVRIPDGVFHWNGRESNGSLAPDGTYFLRVALLHQGRTIDLNDPQQVVKVQTVLPRAVVKNVSPELIPQDGRYATIHYQANEGPSATVLLWRTDLPGGPELVKSFITRWSASSVVWNGKINERPAPAGTYLVGLRVINGACQTARFPASVPPAPGTTPHAGVTVRYLAAEGPLTPVTAGSDAVVHVQSAGLSYRWSLAPAAGGQSVSSGTSAASTLSVPVPGGGSGLYVLGLQSATGSAQVPVVVDGASSAPVLVVLPALTWQGLNPVDDTGDGLPNLLTTGGPIELSRPLVDGLPAGFADETGLLTYLGASRHSYELTTDLGLIDGTGPGLAGHRAVILAGSERWLPASLLSALRAYVMRGGRVLNLGADSLRQTVLISGDRAYDPGPLAPVDVLGGRPNATGAGQPARGGRPDTYRLGAGTVIDLEVPGFGGSLPRNGAARQLMGRIWSVLSA
jgi:hypothetical protein